MRRWIPFIILLVVVGLAVPFLWNEKLDTTKKIDASKISAFATLLASLFTAVTVFLLYKQNQHILEDRNAATQPDIFPLNIEMHTFNRRPNVLDQKSNWTPYFIPKPFEDIFTAQEEADYDVVVPIKNIGLGLGKRIMAFWKYDKNEVVSMVDLSEDNIQNLLHSETLSFLNFLPVNGQAEITVPSLYSRCLDHKLLKEPKDSMDEWELMKLNAKPELHLKIQCTDVYNKPIENYFVVLFECHQQNINVCFEYSDEDEWNNFEPTSDAYLTRYIDEDWD